MQFREIGTWFWLPAWLQGSMPALPKTCVYSSLGLGVTIVQNYSVYFRRCDLPRFFPIVVRYQTIACILFQTIACICWASNPEGQGPPLGSSQASASYVVVCILCLSQGNCSTVVTMGCSLPLCRQGRVEYIALALLPSSRVLQCDGVGVFSNMCPMACESSKMSFF